MSDRVYVIAEAGVNHNGSLDLARKLVDVAACAGADAVKFQTFRAAALVSASAPKADYQTKTTGQEGGQLELLRALELDEPAHHALVAHCAQAGVTFLSTPFDMQSARFLVGLGLPQLKVSSGDLGNAPFLHALAGMGLPLILSSGMALLSDIELALSVVAHGYVGEGKPSREAFRKAFLSPEGRDALTRNVSLLHCTTEYPAPLETVNLRAMETLSSAFGLTTGYSDHTNGIGVSIAAAARGARIIEKHFTLDKTMQGPDHVASLEPDELAGMITGIRAVEAAMGSSLKLSAPAEERNRKVACKGLVALRPIRAGELFSEANLGAKRPMDGRPPIDFWDLEGRPAERDYEADEPV